MALDDYIRAMPKAELHLHLEGSIRPEILLQLAAKYNHSLLGGNTEADIRKWYIFRNFNHFVEIYFAIVQVLLAPDDFELITYDLGQTLAAQNVRYAEITWSPSLHVEKLDFASVLAGVNAGRARAKQAFDIEMRWIPDIVRNMGPGPAEEAARWISSPAAQQGGVVALGLGGIEVDYPPEMFEHAFKIGLDNGLPSNPHAGETVGPPSVWGALRTLRATRIGHGVRSIEDPVLMQYLIEHQIPLEVNLTSNLCLGVYGSYAEHTLPQLVEAGVCVTLNSDDPPMFNTTLNDEYLHAVHDCGLTLEQLETIALNAVRKSYLPDDQKEAMLADFEADYRRLRKQFGV